MVHWTPGGVRGLDSAGVRSAVDRAVLAWRGLGLERGDRIAILSDNRPEWLISDYSLLAAGAVPVPIYISLTAPQIRHILADSGARGIVVSTRELLERVLEVRPALPALEHIILMDAGPQGPEPPVMAWRTLMERGSELRLRDPDAFERIARAAGPSDLATIIYTSGTTGDPKGVMLTHANFLSNVKAVQKVFSFTPADRALSFLPLSHVFERMADYVYMMAGVTIVHVSLEEVAGALTSMRPTVLVAVPRLYEKMRERIQEKVAAASSPQRSLFEWARELGRRACLEPLLGGEPPSAGTRLQLAIADRLVLRKVRAGIGGRVRTAVSAGAPLPREVFEYFAALGILICEGYGLTETSPTLTVNHPGAIRPGTVGPPVDGVELRIATDGEILARGPGIMKGYFNNEEATREAIVEGWFHTGDIGELDGEGCLRITDRKKDLIVTSGGKNVAPQPLEQAILATGKVSQAVIIGNGRKFISALIVPEPAGFETIRAAAGLGGLPRSEALAHPRVVEAFRAIIEDAMRPFATFEQVKRFALLDGEFSIESDEMTPTMKIKRRIVEQRYRELIESFYAPAPEERP